MSDIENHEVTSHNSKELIKKIEAELLRIKLPDQDSHGNQQYESNEILDEKVRALLVDLQLSVRSDAIIMNLQLLNLGSISDILYGAYQNP